MNGWYKIFRGPICLSTNNILSQSICFCHSLNPADFLLVSLYFVIYLSTSLRRSFFLCVFHLESIIKLMKPFQTLFLALSSHHDELYLSGLNTLFPLFRFVYILK